MEYMWYMQTSDELYHHGIKGQKWGIRRFQNRDGSLKSAGKARRRDESSKGNNKRSNGSRLTTRQKVGIGVGIGAVAAGIGLTAYANHRMDMEMAASVERMNALAEQTRSMLSNSSQMSRAMSSPVSEMLRESVTTARAHGVPENQILRSLTDIDNYFRN